MKYLALIALLLATPAYAGQPVKPAAPTAKLQAAQVQQNPLVLLQNFSVADLEAAIADAQAQSPPDAQAAVCYTTLLGIIKSGVANPLPAGPGIFQALQKARDAKSMLANLQSSTGPLSTINNACAPLILDAQNTILGLGVAVGLVANPVGASAALAGLPAGIAAFLALPSLPLPFKLP